MLFGRQRELEQARQAVRDHPLVTLWGPPGVGKTRLATELDASFCDLMPARSSDDFIAAVALGLGLSAVRDGLDTIGRVLASRDTPLVTLDNYEHLRGVADEALARLRALAPGARWLVTSRETLGLPDEHVIAIDPLALDDARTMLMHAAGLAEPTRAEERALDHIARAVEGLPLAITLAAAQLRILGTEGVCSKIPNMSAAIDWSWELLNARQRDALTRCAVFRGTFDIEDAEAVIGEGATARMAELAARQLVRIVRPGIFQLFAVVREHAARNLTAPMFERHAAHCLARGRALADHFEASGEVDAWLVRAGSDLVAVMERAATTREALDAALLLGPVATTRGPLTIYAAALERLLPQIEPRPRDLKARGFARYLRGELAGAGTDFETAGSFKELGRVHHARRDIEAARSCYRRALERAGERTRAVLIGNLGALDHDVGRYEQAEQRYKQALKLFRKLGDGRLQAIFSTNLAVLDAERWQLDGARDRYELALELLHAHPDTRLEAITRGNLGTLHHARGDMDAARTELSQAIALAQAAGELRTEALCHARLAGVLAHSGLVAHAEVHVDRAELLVDARQPLLAAVVSFHHAFLDLAAGDVAAVNRRLRDAAAPDGSPLAQVSDDARMAQRILTRAIEARRDVPPIEVAPDHSGFCVPGGSPCDLRPYAAEHRIFQRLVEEREARPGTALDVPTLFAVGWPNESIAVTSAANRVYVALTKLRKRGLKPLLLRQDDGYLLDPAVPVAHVRKL